MQLRLLFAVIAVPLTAGTLGVTTRGATAIRRLRWFVAAAFVLAALFLASPFDPRIPHTEHMAFTVRGFLVPLLGACAALMARERGLAARATLPTRVETALLGALIGAAVLLASALLGGETARMLLDALASP